MVWGGRGRLTMSLDREKIIGWVNQAKADGARQNKACEILGMSTKTLQRWISAQVKQDKRQSVKRQPKNKLSEFERKRVIKCCNQPQYAHLPPAKLVAKWADDGFYLASESTVYRLLKAHKQLAHRQSSGLKKKLNKPRAYKATGPNQVYSWDITYLPSPIKGRYYYLYLVLDIYSRKIVGWQIHDQENSTLASELIKDICYRENIKANQVVLHSDNGSPMKGATMLATLEHLGITPSFSRPAVSNDNPYSEALFRTIKYCPKYPEKAFISLNAAREWMEQFSDWYNHHHQHSALKMVTPNQRHSGEDKSLLEARKALYRQAQKRHPERWSKNIKNWDIETEVLLNPEPFKTKKSGHYAA